MKGRLKEVLPTQWLDVVKARRQPLDVSRTARFNFFPISSDPPVIFTYTGWTLGNVFHMSRELSPTTASFIVGFTKYPAPWKLRYLRRQLRVFQREFPGNRILFHANSPEELANMQALGLEARFAANNALQHEHLFTLRTDVEKKYDAVMNARMIRVKRMELASSVQNLALVTILDDESYLEEMRLALSEAHWLNFNEDGIYEYLRREEISDILNASRVGLILSALEGNNRASIEYLLCGIPVLSTPSKGGRDEFFDERSCLIVPPDAGAVREGVEELAGRTLDPSQVRKTTLKLMVQHRSRFMDSVAELSGGRAAVDVGGWRTRFPNNMRFRCNPAHFTAFYQSSYLNAAPAFESENALQREDPNQWQRIIGNP